MKQEILILDRNNVFQHSKTILAITLFLLTFSVTVANAASVSSQVDYDYDTAAQNLKAIDGRERSSVKASISFKFFAQDICNEDVGKNGRCLDIWGKGSASAGAITGSGSFETYIRKPVDLNKGQWLQLSRGQWSAVDLLAASEKQINFKASTSSGIVFIELTEGKSENSGRVCVYGSLIAVQKAEGAVCVGNTFVVIGKTGK